MPRISVLVGALVLVASVASAQTLKWSANLSDLSSIGIGFVYATVPLDTKGVQPSAKPATRKKPKSS